MLIADLNDHGAGVVPDRFAVDPSRRPLAQWLAEDQTLLARAAHRLARLRRCSVEDAEDAIQETAGATWEQRESEDAPTATTSDEALALLVCRAPRSTMADQVILSDTPPMRWTAGAIEAGPDAAGVSLAARRFSPNRAGALLAHLRGEATLEETGEALGGLTRERARQCRDELVTRLRRWYGPERAFARSLHAARAGSP